MSSAQNNRAFPTGPLGLFETCGEPISVGQVAMANDHGGWETMQISGTGSSIGRQSLGLPMRDGMEACGNNSMPGEE